jgi:hypothetical protein
MAGAQYCICPGCITWIARPPSESAVHPCILQKNEIVYKPESNVKGLQFHPKHVYKNMPSYFSRNIQKSIKIQNISCSN